MYFQLIFHLNLSNIFLKISKVVLRHFLINNKFPKTLLSTLSLSVYCMQCSLLHAGKTSQVKCLSFLKTGNVFTTVNQALNLVSE